MKKLLLASIIMASFSANAAINLDVANFGQLDKAEAKIIVGFGSYHFDSVAHEMLNEINPAIGFEAWDIKAVYVSANSWDEKSLYLTYSPDYKVNDYLSFSADIGLATGYTCDLTASNENYKIGYCSDSGIVFLPALTVDVSPFSNNFALSISVTPEVAMFSTSYSF
jgi:hypothetical protein